MKYSKFLKQKQEYNVDSGFLLKEELPKYLFPFQKDCVKWSLKRGKSALFQECGLGKTIQQLVWAKEVHKKTGKDILILAPLAVSKQTKREGQKFKIKINICSSQKDVKPGINITNYEKLHKFNPDHFGGIVLDESGILKSYSGKFRNEIIQKFQKTPYKLACTATPSPNDYMELGNHSEFLGIMTRSEMMSTFFINDAGDTGKWRLKGHAQSEFWKWICSWAVMMRRPSDLGYDDNGFILPKIHYHSHIIPAKNKKGFLVKEAIGLTGRREARKNSLSERVEKATSLINGYNDSWLLWCDLNVESELLSKNIPDSVEIRGSNSDEHKTNTILDFINGKEKILITKPKIAGFGLNMQICHNMIYVGLSDSFEAFYQATRRCWRFGQKEEVHVHIIYSEEEGSVIRNIKRKERDFDIMSKEMIKHMAHITSVEIKGSKRELTEYNPQKEMELPKWLKQ